MIKNIKIAQLVFLLITTITLANSCRKDDPKILSSEYSYAIENSIFPYKLFYDTWNSTNTGYVFWDIDTTDWDAIYVKYEPQFYELSIEYYTTWLKYPDYLTSDNYAEYESVLAQMQEIVYRTSDLLDEMCSTLIDHHYKVVTSDSGVDIEIRPAEYLNSQNEGYLPIYQEWALYNSMVINAIASQSTPALTELLDKKMLKMSNDELCYLADESYYIYSAIYDNDIAYIRFPNFAIDTYKDSYTAIGDVYQNYCNMIESDTLKGLVIDLRHNMGGDCNDLKLLAAPLVGTSSHIPFAYYRQKSGLGRLDFSPYQEMSIPTTNDIETKVDFPIAILCDSKSISMSEITPLAFRQISDNVKVIGTQTYGATSPKTDHFIYEAGINTYLNQACIALVTLEKESIEGIGIFPDIEVAETEFETITFGGEEYTRFQDGIDYHFDKAVEYIRSK